jgi:hypothetical protein
MHTALSPRKKRATMLCKKHSGLTRVFVRGLVQVLKETVFFSKPLTGPRTNSRVFSTFFSACAGGRDSYKRLAFD